MTADPAAAPRRIDVISAPVRAASPNFPARAATSAEMPPRKLHSEGRSPDSLAELSPAPLRRCFMAPRITLPYFSSSRRTAGNVAGEAELFRIAGPDSGDKRADQIGEQVRAEFAPHECGDGFVLVGRVGAKKRLGENAQLGAQRSSSGVRQELRRAERRGHQPPAMQDVTRRASIGAKEFAAEAEFVDQFRERRRIREALRADVEAESVLFHRVDDAAEAAAALQQKNAAGPAGASARRRPSRRFRRR